MGGFDLREYVKQQLAKGFSPEQVREFLLSYHYPEADVNRALAKAARKGLFARPSRPAPALVQYIRQNLSLGYDIGAITRSLYQNNYPPQEVAAAVDEATRGHQHVHHTIDVSARTLVLFLIISLSIGLIVGGAYYFLSNPGQSELLDYQVELEQSEVAPGEQLYFTNRFVNIGERPKYDIFIEYLVTTGNTTIYVSGETIGVDNVESSARHIEIPVSAPSGLYRLTATVTYGEQVASSYVTFRVKAPNGSCSDGVINQDESGTDCGGVCAPCQTALGSCMDGMRNQDEKGIDCGGVCEPCETIATCKDRLKNQGEQGIDCGGPCAPCATAQPTCSDGIRNQDETGTDCGGICAVCTGVLPDNQQILAKVRSAGRYDEKESLRLCNTITDERLRDDCFLEISQSYNASVYCERLQAASKVNICYMYFVQNGDYSICEKLTEVHTRRICESLRQINTIIAQQNLSVSANITTG
jgi:hypothetical protein